MHSPPRVGAVTPTAVAARAEAQRACPERPAQAATGFDFSRGPSHHSSRPQVPLKRKCWRGRSWSILPLLQLPHPPNPVMTHALPSSHPFPQCWSSEENVLYSLSWIWDQTIVDVHSQHNIIETSAKRSVLAKEIKPDWLSGFCSRVPKFFESENFFLTSKYLNKPT